MNSKKPNKPGPLLVLDLQNMSAGEVAKTLMVYLGIDRAWAIAAVIHNCVEELRAAELCVDELLDEGGAA